MIKIIVKNLVTFFKKFSKRLNWYIICILIFFFYYVFVKCCYFFLVLNNIWYYVFTCGWICFFSLVGIWQYGWSKVKVIFGQWNKIKKQYIYKVKVKVGLKTKKRKKKTMKKIIKKYRYKANVILGQLNSLVFLQKRFLQKRVELIPKTNIYFKASDSSYELLSHDNYVNMRSWINVLKVLRFFFIKKWNSISLVPRQKWFFIHSYWRQIDVLHWLDSYNFIMFLSREVFDIVLSIQYYFLSWKIVKNCILFLSRKKDFIIKYIN